METRRIKKLGKGIVDVVLLIGLVFCVQSTSVFRSIIESLRQGAKPEDAFSWGTAHCIMGIILSIGIIIHIWQHWNFIKTLVKKKLFSENKITTITLVVFILTVISYLFFLIVFSRETLHNHSLFAHIFVLVIVIHFITRIKSLIRLFKR